MATVGIAVVSADKRSGGPVSEVSPVVSESITSSGTSTQTTITASKGDYVRVTSSGGAVWATFGTNPTASAGTSYLITDGMTEHFYNSTADALKVAVINA